MSVSRWRKSPILELSGQLAGPSEPKLACTVGAGALPICSIGIDREARRQSDDGRSDLRRRRGMALELRGAQFEVETGGRIGFGCGRARFEDGVEGLVFTSGDRRIAGATVR